MVSISFGWLIHYYHNKSVYYIFLGNIFENAEIDNGDWCDFDEKNGNSVAVSEFKSNFAKVKGKK